MSYNPYASDGADDDLFEDVDTGEEVHGHAVDGSLCKKCLRPHNFNAPAEIRSSVIEMMRHMPPASVTEFLVEQDFDSHLSSQIAYGWLNASSLSVGSGARYPIHKAVIEVLDEMSGGKVSLMWEVYETERVLYANHRVLSQANNVLERIKGERDNCTHPAGHEHRNRLAQSIHVLGFICEIAIERVVTARKDYTDACTKAGIEAKTEDEIMSVTPDNADDIITRMMVEQIHHDIPEHL